METIKINKTMELEKIFMRAYLKGYIRGYIEGYILGMIQGYLEREYKMSPEDSEKLAKEFVYVDMRSEFIMKLIEYNLI